MFSVCFPYCLIRREDGRYVATNRRYKPIGYNTDQWVDYDTLPICHSVAISPATASRLDHRGRSDLDRIYLYGGESVPETNPAEMQAYLERLAILGRLKIDGSD